MNDCFALRLRLRVCSVLCLLPTVYAVAQTKEVADPDPSRPANASARTGSSSGDDETLTLTPFEVKSDSDKSYGALNSNSITRFNTELARLPVSADIFDSTFMKDIGGSSVEDMIMMYSAGAGSALASPGTSSTGNQPGDRNANSFISLRGLTAPTTQRDGFLPVNTFIQSGSTGTGYTNNFDVERVEVINGPQALLYGVGGAGGVINLVSKQARIGGPTSTQMSYQVDQYGHKLGLLDFAASYGDVAIRLVTTDQYAQGGRRVNLGGPMDGLYLQIAARVFKNTVIRLTGEQTIYDRIAGTGNQTYTALSATNDVRSGQHLRYLLATNQINAAANGGASGGGVIGNGNLNWDNIDSYGSWWNTAEYTKTSWSTLSVETQWNSWLSTQFNLGYRDTYDDRAGNTVTFAAPNLATNPLGVSAMGMTGNTPFSDLEQPSRQKAIRFSMLATNDLFGGRVHSQTVAGADFVRTDGSLITYAYVQADGNFRPTTANTAIPTGYTYASPVWWSVNNGFVKYPFWSPRAGGRGTFNGQNYVRAQTNVVQSSLIGPSNPLGLLPGGATPLGDYRMGKTLTKGVYAANYTSWFGGKLNLLFGARAGDSYSVQATESAPPSPNSVSASLDTRSVNFNAGANYALTNWLSPYVSVSDSIDPPAVFTPGPFGAYPIAAHGVGEEVGVKVTNAAKTLSGSLAIYHANSKNEEQSLTSTILFDINPSGLNGFSGAPSVWINVDRQTEGLQLALTASPTSNWRMRLSAATTDGTIGTTRKFQQVYNDQFYADATGNVTYKDGTQVYVRGTGTGANAPVAVGSAGAVPLTIAKMNDKTDLYYANPLAVTGAITRSSLVGRVLTTVDATHGPILTGATGLPISAIQINPGFTLPGTIVTNVAGEKSTGYPQYSAIFTNNYTFSSGLLRGLSVGGTVALGWKYRQYYYYPNGLADPNNAPRSLFIWPTQTRFDGILGYSRKVGRKYLFSAQLNVNNMFNRYHVLILPNPATGFSGVQDATFDAQPRTYILTTGLSF